MSLLQHLGKKLIPSKQKAMYDAVVWGGGMVMIPLLRLKVDSPEERWTMFARDFTSYFAGNLVYMFTGALSGMGLEVASKELDRFVPRMSPEQKIYPALSSVHNTIKKVVTSPFQKDFVPTVIGCMAYWAFAGLFAPQVGQWVDENVLNKKNKKLNLVSKGFPDSQSFSTTKKKPALIQFQESKASLPLLDAISPSSLIQNRVAIKNLSTPYFSKNYFLSNRSIPFSQPFLLSNFPQPSWN